MVEPSRSVIIERASVQQTCYPVGIEKPVSLVRDCHSPAQERQDRHERRQHEPSRLEHPCDLADHLLSIGCRL
jgi:hypothetical protein